MKKFKFFQKEQYTPNLPFTRYLAGRTISNELVPVEPLGPPSTDVRILRNSVYGALNIRECAVIASSIRDFNNWKREIFDLNFVNMITSGCFTHTNGNNGVITRYRAITNVNHCWGQIFDDYVLTDRISDILASRYHDTMNDIRQLIVEVRLHIRR